jgi:hypothetical protein
MNKKKLLLRGGVLLFLNLLSTAAFSQAKTDSLLIGTWALEDMEFDDRFSDLAVQQRTKMIEANSNRLVTFSKNGQYKNEIRNGTEINVGEQGSYQLVENCKYLISGGQSAQILFLDEKQLKLQTKDSPVLVFKKIK